MKETKIPLDEHKKEILRKALENAELAEAELEEVAGGLMGCGSCTGSCEPGCSPGHVNSIT